ncbi:RecQ family ATP-dependent DNA helicase [Amnibacterium endophyticum]|uniref:ATP-dependent DNA helicase RecQ n=1 Tax=Amnibacterium endophyticum TaxID=2109337 RepID=A0ABW4LD06_9MICO
MTTTETEIEEGRGLSVRGREGRDIERAAREVFGWDPLRPGIARAVADVIDGADVLGVMPTGYGKSAVYQLAGAILPGTVVVVSPLIALQADQVAGLNDREGTRPAAIVNSTVPAARTREAWERLADGSLGYLFLAPEQLANEEVVERLAAADVAVFVVDEAHCVSSWGHDFRPDYLRLGEVAGRLGGDGGRPPVLALTATGSRPVREEIVQRLGMFDARILTHGFDRPNIHLSVRRYEEERDKVEAVLDDVEQLQKPGLLYVATKKGTEVFAERLAERGMRAAAYHGGLPAKRRRELHAAFHDGEYDVVVATSAFGMGIDKSDVRFVVHAAIPESVDEYYQELGRAGRDGEPAAAKLHYREEDLGLRKFFGATKPKRKELERFVAAANGRESLKEIAEALDVTQRRAMTLANLLADARVAELSGREVRLTETNASKAADAALEAAEARQRIDESRLAMVRQYAETRGCRRQFVLGYFGDETSGPCGRCDTCDDGSAQRIAESRGADDEAPFPVDSEVRHAQWGGGRVMSVEDDRVTVFFETEGYRTLSLAAVAEHDLLERA